MSLKKKIIISITSLLILSISLIIFVISPLFLEIKEVSQAIPLKKQELAELEKKLENLDKFREVLSGISSDLEKINHLFIDDPKAPIAFREFLENVAKDSKVYLEILPAPPSRATDTGPWEFAELQLNLVGPFINFSNFLEKLEVSPYLIEIQNFNIVSETKTPELKQFYLGNVKAKLLIKVYAE